MKRISYLESSIYHRKFKEIYKLLLTADLDKFSDYSTWYRERQDFISKNSELWIVAESKILNLRMWICKEYGELRITTAKLDLDINTEAYARSYKHFKFNNQKEMSEFLRQLLEPCLLEEDIKEEDEEICC